MIVNKQLCSAAAFVLSACLVGCMLTGCSPTRWMGIESGEYTVVSGGGEANEAAMRAIQRMKIDRDERAVVFTLADNSEIVASFTPRSRAEWPAGCPTNIFMHRMQVLDLEEDTLTLGPIALDQPILVRDCPRDPMRVVLREDGEVGTSGSACSWTDTCICFGPQRDLSRSVNTPRIIVHGAFLSLLASAFIAITLRIKPRIWLQDYPQAIQDRVPPKNAEERKLSLILGIPFLALLLAVPFVSTLTLKHQHGGDISFLQLFANGFGVLFIFNLVDWLIIDWLMFCTITPQFIVIPGAEGAVGYKNYAFHFRGFLIGTVFSTVVGMVIAGITLLL